MMTTGDTSDTSGVHSVQVVADSNLYSTLWRDARGEATKTTVALSRPPVTVTPVGGSGAVVILVAAVRSEQPAALHAFREYE